VGAALWAAPYAFAQTLEPDQTPQQAVLDAQIVFLGELHDNPAHHVAQAKVMAQLQPTAVVFEMLTPEQADALRGQTYETQDDLDALIGWSDTGWPDLAIYMPVFEAARGATLYGAGVPREQTKAIMDDRGWRVFGPEAERFGLLTQLPEELEMTRQDIQRKAHCDALPEAMIPQMVEIQQFRDARLAQEALRAFEAHGGPVVVITGNGHARTDWGAPHLLEGAAPSLQITSIGLLEAAPDDPPPYDTWIVTDGIDRPDPCLAFK